VSGVELRGISLVVVSVRRRRRRRAMIKTGFVSIVTLFGRHRLLIHDALADLYF